MTGLHWRRTWLLGARVRGCAHGAPALGAAELASGRLAVARAPHGTLLYVRLPAHYEYMLDCSTRAHGAPVGWFPPLVPHVAELGHDVAGHPFSIFPS